MNPSRIGITLSCIPANAKGAMTKNYLHFHFRNNLQFKWKKKKKLGSSINMMSRGCFRFSVEWIRKTLEGTVTAG